jgi:ABC-type multidrug transport system ATPase subunit
LKRNTGIQNQKILEGRPVLAKEDKVFRFDEIFIEITSPDKVIPYIGISDGEHQFLQILGAVMIFEREDILFLLDEPETHFNPLWRTKFINILNETTKNRDQEIVITTHSPYIVSDCKGYRVFKFERAGDIVSFNSIDIETYGTSFDLILKKAFDIDSTISDEANDEIKALIKDGTEEQINLFLEESGPSFERIGLIKHLKTLKD